MKKQKGFTLIELVIYMGLLGIFLVIMTNLFVSILDVRLDSQSTSSVQQDGRFIINRLTYDIRRAKQIISPLLANESTSMQLIVNENGVDTNLGYSLIDDQLVLLEEFNQNQLNSYETRVSNLSFTHIGNSDLDSDAKDGLQIKFTLTSNTVKNSGAEIKHFQTTINRR